MEKEEKIQLFVNHSIGTVYNYLKSTNQVTTFEDMAKKISGSYTSMSTRRNEVGGIGPVLGKKLLKTFDLSKLPLTGDPPTPSLNGSKEKIIEDLKQSLVKLDAMTEKISVMETDIALLKKIVLKQE